MAGSINMKRYDVNYTVKSGSTKTLTLTLNCSDTGCAVSMACACNFATGTWKVWKPNGTSVFCGAIVYSCRGGGIITYTLIATQATGTATFATAVVGNTVTVNGLIYTAVAGTKANNTQFSIDTSNCATATDFSDSVTNDTRTPITVPLRDVTSTACMDISTLTTVVTGTAGNSICLSENACTVTVSGALFTGGTGNATNCCAGIWEGEVEYLDCMCVIFDQSGSFGFTIEESY